MYGDMFDSVCSEIEWLGCVSINRENNQVKVVGREHHRRRTDTVSNEIAVGSVIVATAIAFFPYVVDEPPQGVFYAVTVMFDFWIMIKFFLYQFGNNLQSLNSGELFHLVKNREKVNLEKCPCAD